MIFGDQEKFKQVTFMLGEGPDDSMLNSLCCCCRIYAEDEVLFWLTLVVLHFNQVESCHGENPDRKFAIITGLNLPMLIRLYRAFDGCKCRR